MKIIQIDTDQSKGKVNAVKKVLEIQNRSFYGDVSVDQSVLRYVGDDNLEDSRDKGQEELGSQTN